MELIGVLGGLLIGALLAWGFLKYANAKSANIMQDRLAELNQAKDKLSALLETARNENLEISKQLAIQQEHNRNLKQLQEENEKILLQRFENLANDILDRKSQKFTDQNEKNLGILLGPLKEKIEKFEEKVEKSSQESLKWNTSLKTQIENLAELNHRINKEAENLTRALKGESKTRGNWGEVILESILEKSGLVKDREYFVQESAVSEEGRRLQPDVVVKLPEDKHVIIDAKVTLIAYDRYVASDDEDDKKKNLALHVEAMRRHVKQLGDKNYQNLYKKEGLDFVLLFVPIEPAFSIALQHDNELFNEALTKQIVIVSPTTLIATLQTIASIWKNEYQNRNAIEIATQSGNLYDKFVGFTEDLIKIGRSMDTAKTTYEDAMNKLSSGRGNLINRVESIKQLGAKATKAIDAKLIDRSGIKNDENNGNENNSGS